MSQEDDRFTVSEMQLFRNIENICWLPKFQEQKISQYKSFDQVVRYEREVKKKMVDKFCKNHQKHLSWCQIRYIF